MDQGEWDMSGQMRVVAAVATLMLSLSSHTALAQADKAPGKAPGEAESSNMGPGTGNNGAANNGIGTSGSLDHDAGSASSTVAGVNGSKTGFNGNTIKPGTGTEMETDPAQGGGKPHQ